MTELPILGRGALPAIAELCRRSLTDAPSEGELGAALFDSEPRAVVRGDPHTGVVATVDGDGGGFIRLLAVEGAARGQGHGHALVRAAEADARAAGHGRLTVGTDAPFFLWAGVPTAEIALLCLLERHHYQRVDTNFDMTIDLASVPDDPGGHALATAADRAEIDEWTAKHWSNWRAEVLRALDKGNLVISRDDAGISAFCGFEVNRAGFLGPVAVRPDLLGKGAGRSALVGALHELRRRGREAIEVNWVGPIVPYARLGGRVSRCYFVYRKDLP